MSTKIPTNKVDVVIMGAGPAGMACAMELYDAQRKTIILEKDEKVGGLAKTLEFKEGDDIFRTDIGPHRFFSKNQYLYTFIEGLLKEKWILVSRKTRQFIDGKFYDYPIKAVQAFKNIGPIRAFGMGVSYLVAVLQYKVFKKKINSFEDYVVANFGRKLGEFNMINYTEKIWGIPASTIHADWATQRIQGLNLLSALANAIFKKKEDSPKSLVDSFYYPQYGTGLIYETIAGKIAQQGHEIFTRSYPTAILHENDRITEVEYSKQGTLERFSPEHLVSSIPLTHFVSLLSPQPPREVLDAVSKLEWRSQVYLFVTLNKEQVTDDNWIYFPNRDIPFGRISEMKNFSADMAPKDKTSLMIEFFVTEGDDMWNATKEELFELVLPIFERLGFFTRAEVRNYYTFKKTHVYPVYNVHYIEQLEVIKNYLDRFENLYYIGRPGRFRYNNQDHSLEMGIMAAKSILDGVRYDFDTIGTEKEYFEKGEVVAKNA